MKKRFAAVLLIAVAAVSSLAAVDISLAVGGRGTFGELSIGNSANYNFSVDAELDMDFGRGQGMLIGLLVGMQDIDISVGYAYQTDISSNCDFILGAGATLGLKNPVELNFFVTADFDFNLSLYTGVFYFSKQLGKFHILPPGYGFCRSGILTVPQYVVRLLYNKPAGKASKITAVSAFCAFLKKLPQNCWTNPP